MKDGFYFENERKIKESEFKQLLKKHLPEVLAELMNTNRNNIRNEIREVQNGLNLFKRRLL